MNLTQYYDEFKKQSKYSIIPFRYIKKLERYVIDNNIEFNDIYNKVTDFVDTLPISRKASNTYRVAFRDYMEYVYEKTKISKKEDQTYLKYVLRKDGTYYKITNLNKDSQYFPNEGKVNLTD